MIKIILAMAIGGLIAVSAKQVIYENAEFRRGRLSAKAWARLAAMTASRSFVNAVEGLQCAYDQAQSFIKSIRRK